MIFAAVKFWERLVEIDQWLFVKINSDWANPVFDAVMPFFRNGTNWAPLYLFMLVLVLLNFKTRGIWWVVFFISTVALIDMTGNYVFNHGFERLRPCNDPGFSSQVRLLLEHFGVGYGFAFNFSRTLRLRVRNGRCIPVLARTHRSSLDRARLSV